MKKELVRFIVDKFPAKTESIYISGSCEELGNWDPAKALKLQYFQKEEGKEIFFVDAELPVGECIQYKYLNHRDWRSVECGIVAQEIHNRSITVKNEIGREVREEVRGFRIY